LKDIETESVLSIEIKRFWTEGTAAPFQSNLKTSIHLVFHVGVKREGKVFTRNVEVEREMTLFSVTPERVGTMVNQILAHVSNTPFELIDYCQSKGILVEAYSPVAHGEMLKNQEITAMAEKYHVTVPQLCIRYCLQLGMLPLPKTANPDHMRNNAAVDFEISDTDMEALKKAKRIKNYGKVLCVGGGVMIAPTYLQAQALREAGNDVTTVIGARTKKLLFFEDKMKALSKKVYVATDDGSYGHQGLGFLKDVLQAEKFDRCVAIGPVVMMKHVCEMTKPFGIPTVVTLTPIMVDGMGMCGCCRVSVDGKMKFGKEGYRSILEAAIAHRYEFVDFLTADLDSARSQIIGEKAKNARFATRR
jgi:hypothetical protein